jgi:lipoprotein-anchoring transpeptidase ErfK/SrfK
MKHFLVPALVASALVSAPARAEPISLYPDATRAHPHERTMRHAPQHRSAAPGYVAPHAGHDRSARSRAVSQERDVDLGGGFIEFLFGGGRPVPPPRQAALTAPAPQPIHPEIDPRFLPQVVPYHGAEKPGTIVIDTPRRYLLLVQDGGTAMRYGIGVGRPGFTWAGVKSVTAKKEWPDWVPPPEMLKRQPELPTFMAGGPNNPLGARALYLGSSLYRIHGSNEPWTIGQAVSSGCIRMRNEDVMDLYGRVRVGTRVVVI